MKKLFYSLFLICVSLSGLCQINVHSIGAARSETSTTLDSPIMWDAREKLLNPANFGKNGKYKKSISILDGYTSGNLTDITSASTTDIFFLGNFNIPGTVPPFSEEEIDSLYAWSMRGGKVILCAGQTYPEYAVFTEIFNRKWDFEEGLLGVMDDTISYTRTVPAPDGKVLFNGHFGNVTFIEQGGTTRGYIGSGPADAKCFAKLNATNAWAVYLDCKTLDLIVADIDYYTSLGGISSGSVIANMQDRFLANTFAFMDSLQQLPLIKASHDSLSVAKNYLSYQWFQDNNPISGATSYSYNVSEQGNYHVETVVNGGCRVKSDEYLKDNCEVFVPTAFSPNGDGVNDFACAYYPCYEAFEFKIYNRWGEVVFTSNKSNVCWDGVYRGEKANSGTYGWAFYKTSASGKIITHKGTITLIR